LGCKGRRNDGWSFGAGLFPQEYPGLPVSIYAWMGFTVAIVGVAGTMALINFSVAVFNLVPAFPLDGGRVLRAALWQRKDDLRSATLISSQIGRGFGLVLILLGFFSYVGGNLIGGMFLGGAASASYR